MNEIPSRRSQEQSSSRSRSMSHQSNLNNIRNRDELEACNDQTYEEILQRFNSQKRRMQDCPEKGDVIKCTNSCIALQEEYCEVIPCDVNNQEEPSSPRDKERVISTKICDDGCNYIKEIVIERTHFTQEGLVVKTKHIIEKCRKEDERRNSIANKNGTDASNVVPTRKSRNISSNQKQYEQENNQRTRSRHSQSSRDRSSDGTVNGKKTTKTTQKNRYKSNGNKSDIEMPNSSETDQQHSSTLTNSTPRRSCQEDNCCQFFSAPENACCCLTSQNNNNNNNDDCCRPPEICCSCVCQDCMTSQEETTTIRAENRARDDMERQKRFDSSAMGSKVEELADKTPLDRDTTQPSKLNSGLNRRESNGDRPLVCSSTNASDDDEKIDSISIQLFSSSVSGRSNNRSRNQCCPCECEDTCCNTAPTFQNCSATQTEASKLLAEIIIPSEYNCGVSLPSVNGSDKENVSSRRSRRNSQGNARKESCDNILSSQRAQNNGVQHKSVSTATRKERPLSQRNENIQNKTRTDIQEFTVDDTSRRRNSNQRKRSSHERFRNDICDDEDFDEDTLRRKSSKHHERYSICNEDVDNVSLRHSDDFSELDDETTAASMKTNANSTMKKSRLHENSECPTEENAKENSRSRPIKRTIMIPLVYVAPAQGCSNTCRCSGNQPHFIQISGFQSTDSRTRSPLSLQYRIISDEEEDEECNDATNRMSENERLTRRKSSGEEKPISSFALKPFTLSCPRPRYSNDTFVLYSFKRKRLEKNQTSPQREKERESPISSSDSSEDDSSSQMSLEEDRDRLKSSSVVESSATSFLEAGEQCEKTSRPCTQCARKCCCRNQSDTNDRSSSKGGSSCCRNQSDTNDRCSSKGGSSCSDDEADPSITKDRCPPKFNLLAEITLKDANAPRSRPQDNRCAEICCKCKCDSQSDSKANNGQKMHSERAFPSESCESENVSRRTRKRKSNACDSDDFSRGNCSRQSCTDIEKMCRKPCANENSSQSEQCNRPCRCSSIQKEKQCEEEETEAKEPNDPANVVIRSETKEKIDYYRENRRDDNNELRFREERYRKNSINITNVSQAPENSDRATTDADDDDECDESSDNTSSESNDSDDSSTECENNDDCCNQITEKCTQTDPCCCMHESGVQKSSCNDYCFSEINNPPFVSTPDCDYQCFDPPKSNSDPMECFFFTPNNEEIVCPCNASSNETDNKNYDKCSNNGTTQQDTKNIGLDPCCNETNDKSTASQNCCCDEKAQCECEKSFNEKCTQTEECSVQFCMSQPETCNGFCYQESCIHTSPPMASQCVYQCFGHTECCSLPPNPQPVFPTCNMPYPPQYQYPVSQPMPNCQAPCSFPFPDTQPCCHPQYQPQTTTNSMPYCDAFDDQTLPSTSCKK